MKMKHKKKYRFTISLFFALLLTSCNPFSIQLLYQGETSVKTHARALDYQDSLLYIGSQKGNVTTFDYVNLCEVDNVPISGAEDLRGLVIGPQKSIICINSGKEGNVYLQNDSAFQTVFKQSDLFLDGICINDQGIGFAFGDPIDSKFSILKTVDSGVTWHWMDTNCLPNALVNEAAYAASNCSMQLIDSTIYIGTGGGAVTRVLKSTDMGESWQYLNTPMVAGASYGIYALSFWNAQEGVITGGSYLDSSYCDSMTFITNDGGQSWTNISKGLPGYMSSIQSSKDGKLIVATGRMGTYYSLNQGEKWKLLTKRAYYTVKFSDSYVFLSGKNGRIGIYSF
ncbi:WD40/YVTN/BNR-like repeat-containing protein [Putridiphycobacter roseus]|nr:YCF48-related protein [Putridiphycobacter roseus]